MLTMLETYRQHQAHGLAETRDVARDVANPKKVEGAEEEKEEEKAEELVVRDVKKLIKDYKYLVS